MTVGNSVQPGASAAQSYGGAARSSAPASLGDILERVLDKGVVIAGDIQVNLLDIELLTIKLRLVIASLDTAREVGINWWESDPWLSADAGRRAGDRDLKSGNGRELEASNGRELEEENRQLADRVRELEAAAERRTRVGGDEAAGQRRARVRGEDAAGERRTRGRRDG